MADETVSLRVATPKDAEALLALLNQLQQETNAITYDNLSSLKVEKEAQNLAQIARSTNGIVLLASYQDQLIGLATVMHLSDGANAGELGLAVLRDFWHNGVGSLLLDETLYWYLNYADLDHLVLDVFKSNKRAQQLYQHYGFVKVTDCVIKDSNGIDQPAVGMEYRGLEE
ncbi:MAG: GNAT family N-acetyltransferase [Limosilactobacillus gorillae]|jgi:RimJ/RimL family protein N-acetyltransferase|uniref:GNAT family N-acetyltransferase n=1 Tax=Limosilactobacillus gorillae TaxID=1450649 RepID=UPI000AD182FF|nr:GNAT family N-acetyltransferase [Limosilactobacillus gorillae]MDO4855289.1 GNAT family N-acetyltransferase [Limosilactobacillus gorillae]